MCGILLLVFLVIAVAFRISLITMKIEYKDLNPIRP